MPQIAPSFTVDQPVEVVWDFFQDIPQVAGRMPRIELLEASEDGTFTGTMR